MGKGKRWLPGAADFNGLSGTRKSPPPDRTGRRQRCCAVPFDGHGVRAHRTRTPRGLQGRPRPGRAGPSAPFCQFSFFSLPWKIDESRTLWMMLVCFVLAERSTSIPANFQSRAASIIHMLQRTGYRCRKTQRSQECVAVPVPVPFGWLASVVRVRVRVAGWPSAPPLLLSFPAASISWVRRAILVPSALCAPVALRWGALSSKRMACDSRRSPSLSGGRLALVGRGRAAYPFVCLCLALAPHRKIVCRIGVGAWQGTAVLSGAASYIYRHCLLFSRHVSKHSGPGIFSYTYNREKKR